MRFPDIRVVRRRARRLALRAESVAYRTIVVPLLEREETEHALGLACRLAAERRARTVLVAPLYVERELPLDARFDLAELKERLDSAEAAAASYGVGVRREIVRTRPGLLGEEVARVAGERRAELVVVGAPVESRRGFRRAFPREVLFLLRAAPCRVIVATGPVAGSVTRVARWQDADAKPTSSSAFSARTPSSRRRTATSAPRSITPSA